MFPEVPKTEARLDSHRPRARARRVLRVPVSAVLLLATVLAPRFADAGPAAVDLARGKQIYQGVCMA